MTIVELEAHRRTVTTPQGPVSCIDVGGGPVALFVHGLGTNALLWFTIIERPGNPEAGNNCPATPD
jgi:hypothetical protein